MSKYTFIDRKYEYTMANAIIDMLAEEGGYTIPEMTAGLLTAVLILAENEPLLLDEAIDFLSYEDFPEEGEEG